MTRNYDKSKRGEGKRWRDLRKALVESRKPAPRGRVDPIPKDEFRRRRRERYIPKSKRCPKCLTTVLEVNKWVVQDGRAICRKCWYALRKEKV
jgi:hypothetical protein